MSSGCCDCNCRQCRREYFPSWPSERIPTATSEDGHARVKIVAGEALGRKAVIETHTPIVYQDWTLEAGADVTQPIDRAQRALAYVFEGAVRIGDREVRDGRLAILDEGDAVRLRADGHGRLLLLAGVPHNEPIAHYGPFVMNTPRELQQAFRDYQTGRMGEITRTARVG